LWLPSFPTDRLRRCRPPAQPTDAPPADTPFVTSTHDVHRRVIAAADAAALGRLAAWCLRYAPLTVPDPPDGVWIDATGAAHLAGGEAALLADLVDRLQRVGFAARAAIADTPGAAHAVARHGEKVKKILPLPQGEG